jgi:hypothetical protein
MNVKGEVLSTSGAEANAFRLSQLPSDLLPRFRHDQSTKLVRTVSDHDLKNVKVLWIAGHAPRLRGRQAIRAAHDRT